MVGKGPRGRSVVYRCREACAVSLRGNWEDFLPATPDDGLAEHVWWRDELRPDQRAWVAGLPLSHDLVVSGPGPAPDVVGYGDTHDAYVITDDGRTLFNVGSVGNPLDEPTPVYAVVEGDVGSAEPGPFGVQLVRVPYDVEAEIAVAHALGMPRADAWERELRTAVWRGRA